MDIKWHTVEGIDVKVNTIKTSGFSRQALTENNDVNGTAISLDCSFDPFLGTLDFRLYVQPCFWDFIFAAKPTLRSVLPFYDTKTRTHIRLAFKAMQMGLPMDTYNIFIESEDFFSGHKKKLEALQQSNEERFAYWKDYQVVLKRRRKFGMERRLVVEL